VGGPRLFQRPVSAIRPRGAAFFKVEAKIGPPPKTIAGPCSAVAQTKSETWLEKKLELSR